MIEEILFHPETLGPDHQFNFEGDFEEVWLDAAENVKLHALYFKVENPRGCVVFAHGNAGNLDTWGGLAPVFNEHGFNLLIYDYRAYGKSSGPLASEEEFYADAELCLKFALEKFDPQQIVLYGRSLGTAMMTATAVKYQVQQLVLETPFVSVPDLAQTLFPFLPSNLPLPYQFDIGEMLPQVTMPISLIHGTDDEIVPYESSSRLLELTQNKAKLYTVPGGHHNDLVMYPEYHKALTEILQP